MTSNMSTSTEEEDPSVLFHKIRQKALSLGITPVQLQSLSAVKNLKAPRKHYVLPVLGVVAVLVVVVGVTVAIEWPVSRRGLTQSWFDWQGLDLEEETCLVDMHDVVLDVTRPPVDCGICRGVSVVEKVQNITPEEFEEKYAYSGNPVVIVDAMKNWTATQVFNFDFFKSIYHEDSPVLNNMDAQCQFFPYKTTFGSLSEVFDMSEERAQLKNGEEPWYIGW